MIAYAFVEAIVVVRLSKVQSILLWLMFILLDSPGCPLGGYLRYTVLDIPQGEIELFWLARMWLVHRMSSFRIIHIPNRT